MKEQKICFSCNCEFSCGNSEGCWCAGYPPILEVRDSTTCLCPACLHELIRQKTLEFVARWKNERVPAQLFQASLQPLLEGIDFYKEGDLFVFTEWYHIRRGSCCGNGCRHCPFKL